MAWLDDTDPQHLKQCVQLAAAVVDASNEPFGSILVSADGANLFRAIGDRRRGRRDAAWRVGHRPPGGQAPRTAERAATVYTLGEHCSMSSAAYAWVGLGRIVYASLAAHLAGWQADLRAAPSPVRSLSLNEVASEVLVDGLVGTRRSALTP